MAFQLIQKWDARPPARRPPAARRTDTFSKSDSNTLRQILAEGKKQVSCGWLLLADLQGTGRDQFSCFPIGWNRIFWLVGLFLVLEIPCCDIEPIIFAHVALCHEEFLPVASVWQEPL